LFIDKVFRFFQLLPLTIAHPLFIVNGFEAVAGQPSMLRALSKKPWDKFIGRAL
jgi:hypothetical protein